MFFVTDIAAAVFSGVAVAAVCVPVIVGVIVFLLLLLFLLLSLLLLLVRLSGSGGWLSCFRKISLCSKVATKTKESGRKKSFK